MRLTTEMGDLDLSFNFSFEMERNNPILSDEGDATIPATLPSTKRNRQNLDHIERIDRVGDSLVDIPAVLQVGSFAKNGRLIVDTAHVRDGYNVSFAIENSSLYCQFKDKTIKEIFGEYNNGAGYQDYTHVGLANIIDHLNDIYYARVPGVDYTIFPVAVSKYKENDVERFQYNNAVQDGSLVYEKRVVREGDVNMTVPDGYGVSPFVYLWNMLRRLFTIIGYSVAFNVFTFGWLKNVVVLNNCSDTIVNGVINYKDLVPSCKLSELLHWLKDKFHVHVRVDSNDKNVYIVSMENILADNADADYSDMMEGEPILTFNRTSRTVLSSGTSIEGAAPAAETFDALIEKYGGFFPINEAHYANMIGGTFQYHDCLVYRYATGDFYEIRTNFNTGKDEIIHLGTNYFKYDRHNSEESEEYAAIDEMPPMIAANKMLTPYIGDRTHTHTTFNESPTDTEQPIIIVQEVYAGPNSVYQSRIGTTQGVVPMEKDAFYLAGSLVYYHCWSINGQTQPATIYSALWAAYNKQLRNGIIEVATRLLFTKAALSMLDMTQLKLLRGKMLLPKSFTIPIGEKTGLSQCHFLLIKDGDGLEEDEDVIYDTPNRIKWEYTGSTVIDDLWATLVNTSYNHYDNLYGQPYDNGLLYDQYMTLIDMSLGMHAAISYIARPTGEYELVFTDGIEKLYGHFPSEVGETSPAQIRHFTLRVKMERYRYDSSVPTHYGTFVDLFDIEFENQSAPVSYVAVAY